MYSSTAVERHSHCLSDRTAGCNVWFLLTLYFAVCLLSLQYHRSMREFTVAVRHMAAQVVTEDEIANAAGKTSY
jgi:hypothetical protein